MASLTPWPLHQPIPETCTIEDVCRILQVSRTTFLRRHREWGLVELTRLDWKRRFTGESVERVKSSRWAKKATEAA